MAASARLFHCARCHARVILCRRCDRGHVYCTRGCARQARREALRRAGARYRATRHGRLNNALRQRRFRARQRKVTHQGSAPPRPAALLPVSVTGTQSPAREALCHARGAMHCHRCQREVSPYLRRDFLRSTARGRDPP
jgi:hypothetical protein